MPLVKTEDSHALIDNKVFFDQPIKNNQEAYEKLVRISKNNTARKIKFSFCNCSEKIVFPKKSHWNMIFLVLSGKMIFLFPRNYDLLL